MDLNDEVLQTALKQAAGKYEPLAGEQLRRTVMNAVQRADPQAAAPEILRRTDDILGRSGNPLLRTEAILAGQRRIPDDVLQAGLAAYEGNARGARVLEAAIAKATEKLDEAGKRVLLDKLPALARAHAALALWGGAAGAGEELLRGDRDDPNAYAKLFGKTFLGFVGGAALPLVNKTFSPFTQSRMTDKLGRMFAPMNLLRGETQVVLRPSVGEHARATLDGVLFENRWKTIFGDDNNLELLRELERTGDFTGPFAHYASNQRAREALDDWIAFTRAAAAEPDIIPNPRKFGPGNGAMLYVPHVRKQEWGPALSRPGYANLQSSVSRDPFRGFLKERDFANLDLGIAAGVEYEGDAAALMGSYIARLQHMLAQRQLAADIGKLGDMNNATLISPAQLAQWVIGDSDIIRWPKSFHGFDRPEDAYLIRDNIKALNYYSELDDVCASAHAIQVLKNMMGEDVSNHRENPLLAMAMDANSLLKHNVLSGIDFYHVINEFRQLALTQGKHTPDTLWKSISKAMLPGAWRQYLEEPKTRALMRDALGDGLAFSAGGDLMEEMSIRQRWAIDAMNAAVSGAVGYQGTIQAGGTQEEALRNAAITGGVAALAYAPVTPTAAAGGARWGLGAEQRSIVEHITNVTFNRIVPFWKLSTYQILKDSMGGNGRAAAEYVNQVFGGLNLNVIARSKFTQDLLRLSVLTPDWTESWVRQAGAAFFRGGKDGP